MTHVSVVIPAYQAAPTLAETLDSVAAQTRPPDEIVVVDDGSTDATGQIAARHPLAPRVVRTSNRGASAAINTGIATTRGALVAFLDADDLWPAARLAWQIKLMEAQPEIDLVLGECEAFVCPTVDPREAAHLRFETGPRPGYLVGAALVRRAILDRVGPLDPAIRHGYFIEWFDRARPDGLQHVCAPRLALRRRIRPNTLSSRAASKEDGLAHDFLEIARRAIARRRDAEQGASD